MASSREAVAICDYQSTPVSGGGPKSRTLVLACILALALLPWERGQGQDRGAVWAEAFTASVVEEYLRLLQIAGIAGSEPWSIRPLGPEQLARLSPGPAEHPWSARFRFSAAPRTAFEVVRPSWEIRFNSAFPAGSNDGPTWAGRGFTGSVSGGIAARMGPVSLRLVPTLFRAQNSAFTLQPNGRTDYLRYADGRFPDGID
ncbi:MAG TPA: hypothetical protein VMM17_10925 [Gemmatimonadaceae bacterium]|nr:hypothetical protein [Gemmatimonadaceae bacterium]